MNKNMSVDVALGGHCGIQITVFIADLAKSLSLPTQSYLTHQSRVGREYDDNLMYYTPARNYSSTSVYLSNTVLRVNLFIDENVQLRIKMRVLPTLSKKRRGNRNDFQSLSPLSSPPVIYLQLQYLTLNFVLQDGFSTTYSSLALCLDNIVCDCIVSLFNHDLGCLLFPRSASCAAARDFLMQINPSSYLPSGTQALALLVNVIRYLESSSSSNKSSADLIFSLRCLQPVRVRQRSDHCP